MNQLCSKFRCQFVRIVFKLNTPRNHSVRVRERERESRRSTRERHPSRHAREQGAARGGWEAPEGGGAGWGGRRRAAGRDVPSNAVSITNLKCSQYRAYPRTLSSVWLHQRTCPVPAFRVRGLGFSVQGLGSGVWGLGFGVSSFGLRVWGL